MLALVMVFALAACGDSGEATATPTPAATEPAADTTDPSAETPLEPITIKVGYMNNYGSLWSVLTAEQMGYMEEQGITLELSSFADGPTIISAMESGSIDLGYIGDGAHKLCAAGNAEIIALSHVSNGDAVIGGPNVTSLEDLAGKTVAYSAGTSSEVILTNALNSVGLTMDDMDVIELNEAFASQALAVIRTLGMDPARVNPGGGAMALGHPLGATGAMLTCKALSYLERTGGRYGMVTMCIGGGMGAAGIYELL